MHSLDRQPLAELDPDFGADVPVTEDGLPALEAPYGTRPQASRSAVPLVVDLDGTLIKGDLLLEALLALLKQSFLCLFLLPLWLLRGKAALKAEVAARIVPDPATMVFNEPLLDQLRREKARGRRLVLATGSHERWARRVAEHLGLFDLVCATTDRRNVTSHEKLAMLRECLDGAPFDYAGNERADYPLWQAARRAIVVNASPAVMRWAEQNAEVERVIARDRLGLRPFLKALRPHQWLKNLLMFVPLITAFQFAEVAALLPILLAFVAFSLCASSVYVLNDLVDLDDDRRHPRKRKRPFAAGVLSLPQGAALIAATLGGAVLIALWLPWQFGAVLAAYYAATLAYSFKLKQLPVVDVLTLALLYTVRIVAGAAAAGILLTFWLLVFSVFVFLSLALAKRCAELVVMRDRGERRARGRGYHASDLPILFAMGIGSGYVAALVLGLYINSYQVGLTYDRPWFLWSLVPLLLYWIMYVWFRTYRGRMHDDPVVFAARDPASLAVATAVAAAVALAL